MTKLLIGKVYDDNLFEIRFIDTSTGIEFDADFYSILLYIIKENIGLSMINIFAFIMGIVLLGFFLYHLYLISGGQTTNESFKWSSLQKIQKKINNSHQKYLKSKSETEKLSKNKNREFDKMIDVEKIENYTVKNSLQNETMSKHTNIIPIIKLIAKTDLEITDLKITNFVEEKSNVLNEGNSNRSKNKNDISSNLTIINSIGEEEEEEEQEEEEEKEEEGRMEANIECWESDVLSEELSLPLTGACNGNKDDDEDEGNGKNDNVEHVALFGYRHMVRMFAEDEEEIPDLIPDPPDPFPVNIYNKGFLYNLWYLDLFRNLYFFIFRLSYFVTYCLR